MKYFMVLYYLSSLCLQSIHPAPRKPRLTLAEPMPSYYYTDIGGNSGAYSFGYDVLDPATGNTQFRIEERYPNGTVAGSYGYVDPLGETRAFRYIADEKGFRVTSDKKREYPSITNAPLEVTSTEESITWTRPSRKKPHKNENQNVLPKRQYNNIQPPGFYRLY